MDGKEKTHYASIVAKGISVVLPAFNEEENVDRCIETIFTSFVQLGLVNYEIIFVNDGSTDGTGAKADVWARRDTRVKVIHHQTNLGYSMALNSGFSAAKMPFVFYTDSDNQFDIREIALLLDHIDTHDIVTGFRVYRFDPFTRLILSWGFNLLVRIIFRLRAKDIDCAFKLFRKEVLERIHIESKQFFVDAELLAKARYLGFKIMEVPVRHYPRTAGRSTVRPTHIPYTLWELAKMWVSIYIHKRI